MRIIYVILLVSTSFFVSSCATGYHSTKLTGGYSSTQLDENLFKVSFNGNGYTSRTRSSDFCLLRSAELCKKSGYKYFVIIDEGEYTSHSQYTTSTRTTGNATVVGNSVYGSSTTTGGQTYNIAKPSNTNTILCFIEKPEGFSYNADFIFKSISEKYEIEH